MTTNSRLATKDWNDLTEKEWNAEFRKSRTLVKAEVKKLFKRRPELAEVFEIETEGHNQMQVVWNADIDVEAYRNRPVRFSFIRQRKDVWSSFKPYNGVKIEVIVDWTLSRSHAIRDQKYGLRKDGTHNLSAIAKRIEKILDAVVYDRQHDIDHKAYKKDWATRLNAAHPEFEWDDDGVVQFGGEYFAPTLEILAPSNFDEQGFNVVMKLNGLTMEEVQPLIALVEKYARQESQ